MRGIRGYDSEEAVQLFQDAFEALPEAIAIFDRDDRFVFWNRCFAEVYGEGVDLRAGTRFEDHLRASLGSGLNQHQNATTAARATAEA